MGSKEIPKKKNTTKKVEVMFGIMERGDIETIETISNIVIYITLYGTIVFMYFRKKLYTL